MTAPTDPGALLNELATTYWTTAARHAWSQFQERGRGAIVFPVGDASPPEALGDETASSGGTQPLRYLTFNRSDAVVTDGPFAKLFELIQTYDPEEEVVLAAVLPDERTVFDVYQRDPAPPDAG